MKVFISWSGDASKTAAKALADSLKQVFNGVEPWFSAENIAAGQEWFEELMTALEDARFAIVCLTTPTLRAPWIMFESGAAAAKFGERKVAPLLLDCAAEDLVDPLARFHATPFDRDSVLKLFQSINASIDARLNPLPLEMTFNAVWPKLEADVGRAIKEEQEARKPKYDVFLSAPMASFDSDAQYIPFRDEVMKVVAALRARCHLAVFCALEPIESMADFDLHGVSVQEDMAILGQSGSFVMLYPQKLATSALFETGYALALGLPSRLFVRSEQDLPYLLQRLPEAFTNVSILDSREWKTYDDIADHLAQNADRWFRRRSRAALKD